MLMIRVKNGNNQLLIFLFLVSTYLTSCIDLKDIIISSTICRLQNVNFNIKSFITDQGANFVHFPLPNLFVSHVYFRPTTSTQMFFRHNFKTNDNLLTFSA